MLYDKIHKIEFDLNTKCNSFCPACHRYVLEDGELYLNPWIKFNTDLSLDVIEKVFSSHLLVDDVVVDLVGLLGDAIAHSNFFDVIDIIFKHRPNAELTIHTNGGLRNELFFKTLASKLTKNSAVTFSIDGLEDTNHIYRRQVVWHKVISNITAFVDAGGKAIWKFIVFPWNEHQVDDARQFAQRIGCSFRVDYDRNDPEDQDAFVKATKFNKRAGSTALKYNPFPLVEIDPQCFNDNSIYINAQGKVVPCCMVNSALSDAEHISEIIPFMYDVDPNWNDLSVNSLSDIMHNSWWQKLSDSFESNPCHICRSACKKSC